MSAPRLVGDSTDHENEADVISRRFGAALRDVRVSAGVTQAALAEALAVVGGPDLGHSAIAKIERGSRGVGLGEAALLARVLDAELDDLITDDGARAVTAAELDRVERDLDAARAAAGTAETRRAELLEQLERLADPGELPRRARDKPTAVYHARGADGALLYVGMSSEPVKRESVHRWSSPWCTPEVAFSVEWFPTRQAAREAEAQAIHDQQPPHNVAGRGQRPLGLLMADLAAADEPVPAAEAS